MSWNLISIDQLDKYPVLIDGFLDSEDMSVDAFKQYIASEYGSNVKLTLLQWLFESNRYMTILIEDHIIDIEASNGFNLNGLTLVHSDNTYKAHLFTVDGTLFSLYMRGSILDDVKCYCSEKVALEVLVRKGYFMSQAA
ncbi:MAG: hypothetical protein V7749_00780 [Cocleimonas sp.]